MDIKLCDFCKEIVHRKFYFVSIAIYDIKQLLEEEKRTRTMNEFFEEIIKYNKEVKYYEVCEECFRLFEHFLKMRRQELQDIKEKVNRLLNIEKPKKIGKKDNEKEE